MTLRVLAAGPRTTVQDLGRPGWAHVGVPPSGAADRSSLRLANRLLGNTEDAACLEVTLGGLAVLVEVDLTVVVTGATCPVWRAGVPVPRNTLLRVRAGSRLELGTAEAGLRAYVGVRGGIDVPRVLGSRSTDTLSGIGPPVVGDGDLLRVGTAAAGWPVTDHAPVSEPPRNGASLRAMPGPRAERLAEGGLELLASAAWRVAADSDRVGIRLEGPPLALAPSAGEPPSEPTVRGAVQVPPSGLPVIFLADHPVTGGYPVVAVVLDDDTDLAGQLRPGQQARIRLCPPPQSSSRAYLG